MPILRSGANTTVITPVSPPCYTPRQVVSVGGGGSMMQKAPGRVKSPKAMQFDSYVDLAMELIPFTTSNNIKYVGVLDKTLFSNKARKIIYNEFGCSNCISAAGLLMRMVGTNTPQGGFCQRVYSSSTSNQSAMGVALNRLFKDVQSSPSSGSYKFELRLLPHPSYTPHDAADSANATLRSYIGTTTETNPDHKFYGESFKHYHYPGEKCEAELNDQIYKMQRALDKYTILINELMEPLTCHDLVSIHESIKVLQDDILPSATYASRLNHGVRWFKSILGQMAIDTGNTYTSYREWCIIPAAEKMEIIGNAILGEKIAIDETDGEVTITAYHQLVGSIWSVLKMGGNRTRILRTLEERYCPQKYMRSTAPPSTGKIHNAIATLGDYMCRVHTVYSLAEAKAPILQLRGTPLPQRFDDYDRADSMSAMMNLLAENVTRQSTSKFGLAKRLNEHNRICREMEELERMKIARRLEKESRLRINSMTELMDRVRSGEIWELCVDATDREVVWFGGFYGGKIRDMLCTGNNWAWQYTNEVKVSGPKKVWGIVPIDNIGGFTNWIFIYDKKDALSIPKIKQPIIWEGILKTEHVKKYGSVFSAVGKKSTLNYPTGSLPQYNHPAIGCGVTRNTSASLVRPIRVFINGSSTSRLIYNS